MALRRWWSTTPPAARHGWAARARWAGRRALAPALYGPHVWRQTDLGSRPHPRSCLAVLHRDGRTGPAIR